MRMNVAILGSGNIGCDILCKVQRSQTLNCSLLVGRSEHSDGIRFASGRSTEVSFRGIDALLERADDFELVFDATSAKAHTMHAERLGALGKQIINLTPAHLGELCVPMLNGSAMGAAANINMITCGGQASLPILNAICSAIDGVRYIEVVSSISASSAGPATRMNLDNYITTTELAIRRFTGCDSTKVILNINPAKPEVPMQTAVSVLFDSPGSWTLEDVQARAREAAALARTYVPGYELIIEPRLDGERLFAMVRVIGMGDYLPPYAGNLDIITAAAVNLAEQIAAERTN